MRLSCRRRFCEGREYSLRSSQCAQSIHRPLVNLTSPHPYLFWHVTPWVHVVKPKSTKVQTGCPSDGLTVLATARLGCTVRGSLTSTIGLTNPLRVLPFVTGFWCKCCFPACCVCPETRHIILFISFGRRMQMENIKTKYGFETKHTNGNSINIA